MTTKNTRVLKLLLLILITSLLAAGYLIKNFSIDSAFASAVEKGTVSQAYANAHKECKPSGYEGCLTDYRDTNGKFCFSVRSPDCGKENPGKTATPSLKPTPSPKPEVTTKPTTTPTNTPVPQQKSKLKICKYNDKNGDAQLQTDENTINWTFEVNYQDKSITLGSHWWNVFNRGCYELDVPAGQWINIKERGIDGWNLTNIYVDSLGVGGDSYSYVAVSGSTKTIWFLNHAKPAATSVPVSNPTGEPNSCNGTCGSNYNCQSGYFCFNGFCRNPSCPVQSSCGCGSVAPKPTAPPVILGATAPPTLPKTGSNTLAIVGSLFSLLTAGLYLFKKFKLE